MTDSNPTPPSTANDTWAVAELMGHLTLAGRLTKPGELGGLWQIDIPEGDVFRTEFFGSQSVYRLRIVSEAIARAYARPGHAVVEYDAPIVTRDQHESAMERARANYERVALENEELRRRLTAVNALPPPQPMLFPDRNPTPQADDDDLDLTT